MSIVFGPLIERYLNKFLSLVEHNIKIFKKCPSEHESMRENVVSIQDLLKTVDKHGMKTLEHHTNKLRELMYDAEDITADYSGMTITSRLGIGKKLEDINEELKEMKSKLENSVNAIVASGLKGKDVVDPRQSLPINDVTEIVGVGDAVSKIKKWVTKEDKERKVHYNCIGLVGKGGSGKTTLAQMVLKDEGINQHFQLLQQQQSDDKRSKHSIKKVLFVTVSQPVDVKKMMKSMLKQLKANTRDDDDEGEMSAKIFEKLKGSRYFLILDDVWSLDGGWWKTIKNALPKGSQNCILVTSRMRNIVLHMGVVENQIHVPEALGEEDGWSLFCKNIATDDVSENTELKEIGMEIVRKCCGLPLAIKVMAGVVSTCDTSRVKWRRIRDKFMECLSNNENDSVMGSLGLSYEELRLTYLQPCLLCFGVFPEDHVILRVKMISWWIGEGFVPPTEDGKISVELAERCFDELVNRSLVEVVGRDYKEKVYSCKLHDLVREMLIRKGKSEAFFEIGKDKISRRIVLNYKDISTANSQITASKIKVRAVVKLTHGRSVTKEVIHKICDVCEYLRVLDLQVRLINELPIEPDSARALEKLKHLTCLCTKDVPTNISKLKFLLVLRLDGKVRELPSSITELNKLIWLDVEFCTYLKYLPEGLGNISTLQVLKGFRTSSCAKKGCRFEELRKLTQLVTLKMEIDSADQLSDGELDALSKLDCLRHLNIDCKHEVKFQMHKNLFVQQLNNLVLPKSLDELVLHNYPGEETHSWLCTEDLPDLRYLSYGGKFKHFNKKFYEGKNWGITHLRLNCVFESGDWNVIRGRLPDLKTIEFTIPSPIDRDNFTIPIRTYWDNFPLEEIDEKGVWRNTGERA